MDDDINHAKNFIRRFVENIRTGLPNYDTEIDSTYWDLIRGHLVFLDKIKENYEEKTTIPTFFANVIFQLDLVTNQPETKPRLDELQTLQLFFTRAYQLSGTIGGVITNLIKTHSRNEFSETDFRSRFNKKRMTDHQAISDFEECWSNWCQKGIVDLIERSPRKHRELSKEYVWVCLFFMRITFSSIRFAFQKYIEELDHEYLEILPVTKDRQVLKNAWTQARQNDWRYSYSFLYLKPLLNLERKIARANFWNEGIEVNYLKKPEMLKGVPCCEVFIIEDELIAIFKKIDLFIIHFMDAVIPENEEYRPDFKGLDENTLVFLDVALDSLNEKIIEINEEFVSRTRGIEDLFEEYSMARFSMAVVAGIEGSLDGTSEWLEKLIQNLDDPWQRNMKVLFQEITLLRKHIKDLTSHVINQGAPCWVPDEYRISSVVQNQLEVDAHHKESEELANDSSYLKMLQEQAEDFQTAEEFQKEPENLFRFNNELNNYDIQYNGKKVPIDRRENGTPLDGLHYLHYLIKAKASAPNKISSQLEGDGLDIIDLYNAVNMSSQTHVNEGDGLHIIEDQLGVTEGSVEIHNLKDTEAPWEDGLGWPTKAIRNLRAMTPTEQYNAIKESIYQANDKGDEKKAESYQKVLNTAFTVKSDKNGKIIIQARAPKNSSARKKVFDRVSRVIRTTMKHIRSEMPEMADYLCPPHPQKGKLRLGRKTLFLCNKKWVVD